MLHINFLKKIHFNRNFFHKNKIEILLFLFSLCVQLIPFFILLFYHSDLLFEDKELYWSIVNNIINHYSLSTFIYNVPDAVRPPIYPLFLSFFYIILFKSLPMVLFIQNIIGALSTILVYKIGKNIFNSKIAILASIMYIFEAEHLMMSSLIRSEIIFIIFLLFSILYFIKYIKDFYIKDLIYFSLFLGLATLTRPTAQLFFVIYIFILFIIAIIKKISLKNTLMRSFLIIFIFIATLSPWIIRNSIKLNTLKISPVFEFNLYVNMILETEIRSLLKQGFSRNDVRKIIIEKDKKMLEETQASRSELVGIKFQKYFRDKSFEEIKKDPFLYIVTYFSCKITYCFNDASSYFVGILNSGYSNNPIINIPSFILFPGLYYGMKFVWIFIWFVVFLSLFIQFTYLRHDKTKMFLVLQIFLLTSIIYFAALSFCGGPLTRYRFPSNPLIFMLFANGFYLLISLVKIKKLKSDKIRLD